MIKRHGHGYTLSEILIGLAILSILLSISVPMLETNSERLQKKAVFKESIDILYQILRKGMEEDELFPSNFSDYFMNHMNTLMVCRTNSVDEKCWETDVFATTEGLEAGVVLPNGAAITGMGNCCINTDNPNDWSNGVAIDWNGKKGPNKWGKDVMIVELCYGPDTCNRIVPNMKPGTIAPWPYAQDQDLFNEVYEVK